MAATRKAFGMNTYLQRLRDERDQLTEHALNLTEKAASEERDLTDTERVSLGKWQERCAEIDGQLVEYNAQAESIRSYLRLKGEMDFSDEEPVRTTRAPKPETRGWGDLFTDSDAFKNYQGFGSSAKVALPGVFETRAEIKLADIPDSMESKYLYTPVQRTETTPLLDAMGRVTVGGNTVEWVEWQPAAVPSAPLVAEGALKTEMALTAVPHTDTLDTYAHWKGITRQALEDVPMVRSLVESRLRQGLFQALNGAAVAALEGGTYTGVSNADLLTGIRLGLATAQEQGYGDASVAVVNPADLAAIDLSVMGSTNGGPNLQTSAWGLRFIPVSGVDAGTAYVGDLDAAAQVFERGRADVFITDSHADYFIRNILLILAEIRALVVVSEPRALVKVTVAP